MVVNQYFLFYQDGIKIGIFSYISIVGELISQTSIVGKIILTLA